jgi:predicted O-methyltransferase YrrM
MLYRIKSNPQGIDAGAFSLSPDVIHRILKQAKPLGHHSRPSNGNLGFGFLYYGLVRAVRPKHILVIGSGHGFSVVCLALGLKDNGKGHLSFIDPSYSLMKNGPFHTVGGKSKWDNPQKVKDHFARFGVDPRITHYKLRSDQFFSQYSRLRLPPIDLAFIDGNHAYQEVRYDFLQTVGRARRNGYLFLHDTNIYVRELLGHAGVKRFIQELKAEPDCFEVIDFPFSSGVALVRILKEKPWKPEQCLLSEQASS